MVQGALIANSRFTLKGWKSPLSNAQNPGATKNIAKSKKPKQTQLRKTCNSAEETRSKLDVTIGKSYFHLKLSSTLV
jgi:hypothetical protein